MAARKRASTQSQFLNRAVKAGRSALRQAQRRLPPDVRKQIDKTVKEGQKTLHTAIKQVETRLDRTARQADLEKAMKRLDELSKQVRNMAAAAAAARKAPVAPSTRKAAPRRSATRKPPTRGAATRKAAPPRRATRRSTRKSGGGESRSSNAESSGGDGA
jgi:polyhydroxyalkanoate synthesis regulator phasin